MSESTITKNAIADRLVELTRQKSFDKITVSDITRECQLNRQTFYYHFQDKYELLDWIYYNRTFMPLIENISFDNWNDKLIELLSRMKKEQYFYMNTIRCSENYFQEYLFRILVTLFEEAINALTPDNTLSAQDRHFYARFYAYGLSGLILDWALAGMHEPEKELDKRFRKMIDGMKLTVREIICPN